MRISLISTLSDILVVVLANMVTYDYDKRHVIIYTQYNSYVSCADISYDDYKEMMKDLLKDGYLDLSGNMFGVDVIEDKFYA